MANAWVWWLALVAAVPLLAAPTLMTVRRSGLRRVPLYRRATVRPPGWAYVLVFPGTLLLFSGARGLGGGDEAWLYVFGAAVVSLAVQLAVVVRHNRSAEPAHGDEASERGHVNSTEG